MVFVVKSIFLSLTMALVVSPIAEAFADDLEFSVAASMNLKSLSVAFRPLSFSLTPALHLSFGARNTVFFSQEASFNTAEPKDIREGRNETVRSTEFVLSATNAMVHVDYDLSDFLSLAFNIDLFGVSLGRTTILSNDVVSSEATLSRFNLLVFDNYDHGSLNSQFLIGYKISQSHRISIGLAHQFVEYQSSKKFEFDNRRFRLKDNSVVVSVSKNLEY